MNKHPRAIFWTRFVSWIAVGCGAPITVFATKFGLFTAEVPTVDALGNVVSAPNVSLNGWGIVACLLVGSYLSNIVKEIADATEGYSMMKQVWKGISDTLPLIIILTVCYFLSGVLSQVMYCLTTVIVCKLAATPINPLPKWKWEKKGVEDYSQISEVFTSLIKKHPKEGRE